MNMKRILFAVIIVLVLFVIGCAGNNSQPTPVPLPPPVVVPDNPKLFTFFGKNQFFKFVSYFDAIRANQSNTLITDLDYLKSRGIDGIRIMVNFDWYNCRSVSNDHTNLFNSDGSLNSIKLVHFHNVLEVAQNKELIVDISFISQPEGMSFDILRCGIINLLTEISTWGYSNILFDLANEHGISQESAVILAQDMRNIFGSDDYYYGISVAGGQSPERACDIQLRLEGCNMIRYHDPRVSGWANNTVDLARRSQKCAGDRPVYFDEPPRNGWGGQSFKAIEFIDACRHARNVGIAAWCFHTDAGFVLHDRTFESQLDSEEIQVMDNIGRI